jgi:DNA-binding MarR family transcriptional regulator
VHDDDSPGDPALGTQLRHLIDRLDADVAGSYVRCGHPEFAPRFSPVLRVLRAEGPSAIRRLADAIGVTHSAISQTVAAMRGQGLIELRPGSDGRQRIVHLTDAARALLPLVDAEWAATTAAVADLDAELPVPLARMVAALTAALDRRPFADRIAAAARAAGPEAAALLGRAEDGTDPR